ncbi:MAG: EscU/YscU/HrcU family type III secretion system export apparatus switch protein [Thermincolia bacterium]
MKKDNSSRLAVALYYNESADQAPRVVASGRGLVAEKIIQKAENTGVAIKEEPQLAQALVNLEVGQAIPPELYGVIAEILAFVYQLDNCNKETRKIKS